MTTQYTQSEHNDADNVSNINEPVVDQQHAAETSGLDTSLPSKDATELASSAISSNPDEVHATSSPVQSSDAETTPENTRDSDTATGQPASTEATPVAQNASTTATEVGQEATDQDGVPSEKVAEDHTEELDAVASPVFEEESEEVVAEVTPVAEVKEEYHPFTSFIQEFRQAQAQAEAQAEADLNATLQESQAGAFAEFALPESNTSMVDEPVTVQDILPPVDFGEGSAFIPTSDGTVNVNVPSPNEAVTSEETQRMAAVTEANNEEVNAPATQQPERPVSPLLRPAQRRFQRHGPTRHRDEPVAPPTTTEEATTDNGEAPVPSEPTTEMAKPQRRYRFDRRPAAHAAPVSEPLTSTAATNNGTTLTPPPVTQPTPTFARVEENQVTKPESTVSSSTTPAKSEVAIPEPPTVEKASTEANIATTSTEHGRRKQNGDRHRAKEQIVVPPVTAPEAVADIAAALVEESKATPEDVAPEDMPPLEYAELQRANSRRRRRHRTPNGNGTSPAKEVAASNGAQPDTQIVPPTQPEATSTPARPAANAEVTATANNPYTIVSGYTVGQMNQGNEASGPFMGPEPSPARGSVNTTRDGRTVRVESQPLRTTYPPVGSASSAQGIAPASMNHFANIVSQAIQTQTDRMVAELRRGNQAPTNVSVSLPPFPSTERVGVFVDVANLLYSARTQRIAIDFGKLLDFLRGNRRLVRAHAYCPTSPQPGDEQMFLTAVKGLGYRITTKNYKTFASGAKKADLDLDLCMDVVRLVDGGAVDCIVLVSGDSDFMPMLDYCSDHGVRVEVAAFDEAMSQTLRQSCDLFVNLSMLEDIRA